jgi:hypothetical protein
MLGTLDTFKMLSEFYINKYKIYFAVGNFNPGKLIMFSAIHFSARAFSSGVNKFLPPPDLPEIF